MSAHCTQCGAPDEGRGDLLCGFCGEALNDGRDWLIDRFLSIDDAEAQALLSEASRVGVSAAAPAQPTEDPLVFSPPDRPISETGPSLERGPGGEELYGWCLRLAYGDHRLTRGERKRLANLADRLGVSPSTARAMRTSAQFGRLQVDDPTNPAAAGAWLQELKSLAEVDGQMSRSERRVLADLEARLLGSA